jgi:hypothetical protein
MRSNITISGGWEYCANGVALRRGLMRSRLLYSAVLCCAVLGRHRAVNRNVLRHRFASTLWDLPKPQERLLPSH